MKKKNQKLFIIVGVLLLFGGVSLAYFVSKILTNGNGGNTSVTTAVIKGATVNVEGVLSFEDLDILPGHKSVSSIKVTATGNNELIPYNLIWQGTNTLTTPLNFTIYKTSEKIEVKATCEDKSKMIGASKAIYEECNISNIDRLGTEIATGVINKNDSKVTLAKDEFITASPTGQVSYYYVILEYPNLDEPQNVDAEGLIEGEVTVEESNIKPDINILAAYVVQEDGTYKEAEDIPQSGYVLNEEKSTCSNGATPTGIVPNITVYNLSKSGTSCYLYFDKATAGEIILASISKDYIKEGAPDFSKVATGIETEEDNGIYKAADPMYGENAETYYWRGAATTNHVIFADKCWRIIRINGDGSIRLIYNGAIKSGNSCPGNGSSNGVGGDVAYNTWSGVTTYMAHIGYTFTLSAQRPSPPTEGTDSELKKNIDTWYNNNIGNNETYASKVADGKYCNDRNLASGSSWNKYGTQYFAGNERVVTNKEPSLVCDSQDVYTLKAGTITSDEVSMAGGVYGLRNKSYFLYSGNSYWTMSPGHWSYRAQQNGNPNIFFVNSDGILAEDIANGVGENKGVRVVINLASEVSFVYGNGSQYTPFIVAD